MYIFVQNVAYHYIRAQLNLIVNVDGLYFFDGTPILACISIALADFNALKMPVILKAVTWHKDYLFSITYIEITYITYGGHLGHVFKSEGFSILSMYIRCCCNYLLY
jgi:hypothetical protein